VPVTVSLANGSLYFSGCNVNINGYTLNNGNFSLYSPEWVSTRRFCLNDPDDKIQNLFKSVAKADISP
jgi:hypothetical protein